MEASRVVADHGVVQGLVFRWTTHHVREIFAALLPGGYVLDGSSVVQVTCGPRGDEPQYRQCLGSSQYFVEAFDFAAYARAPAGDRERVILSTLEAALCDIAGRAGADTDALRETAAAVRECDFRLDVEVRKLGRTLRPPGQRLRVFRRLRADLGEAWVLRVVRGDGSVIAEEVMNDLPDYLDRRDHFKASEWADGYYVVRDRLGKETFRLDVSRYV